MNQFHFETGYYTLIVIGGLFLNLLVIVGLLKKTNTYLRDFILVSLACSDFIQTCLGMAWEMYGRVLGNTPDLVCQIAGFGVTFCALTSITHLAALSVERYLSMVHALRTYEYFQDTRRVLFFIIPAWINGIFWGAVPLFGWGAYIREPIHKFRCSVLMTDNSPKALSYTYCLLVFCYIIPILIIAFCCLMVHKELNDMTERSEAIAGSESGITLATKKAEKQHFFMISIVMVTFFVAWTPYALVTIWYAIFEVVPIKLITYSGFFAKFSVICNPIVYVIFYKDFRLAIKRVFCGRGRVTPGND